MKSKIKSGTADNAVNNWKKGQLLSKANANGIEKIVLTTGKTSRCGFEAVVLHVEGNSIHVSGDCLEFSKSAFVKFTDVLELNN